MSSLSAQKATTSSLITAYNTWSIDAILAVRAPTCIHQVLPLSLGRPSMTNAEYRERFGTFMPLFENFTITVLKEIHDAEAHTCMIHARSTADTKKGKYANEYALFLEFTEDGEKVLRFEEFVDSAYTERFFAIQKVEKGE